MQRRGRRSPPSNVIPFRIPLAAESPRPPASAQLIPFPPRKATPDPHPGIICLRCAAFRSCEQLCGEALSAMRALELNRGRRA